MRGLRRLAAVTMVAAVSAFWFGIYRSLPTYPPRLGLSLAIAAILFLIVLALLYQIHRAVWPGLAKFGFVVSAIGLSLWITGGTLHVIAQPQPGWGLFAVGLIPIGIAAIRSRLPNAMRLLLPLGLLFVVGEPLKYFVGERTGGLTVLILFGAGWLAIALLLLPERSGETL